MRLILCLWLFLMPSLRAQTAEPRSSAFTLSIFGPLSTNWTAYDQTVNHFCIGLINCSSLDMRGLSFAYGVNIVEAETRGILLSAFGNYTGGDAVGFQLGYAGNYTGGAVRGVQLGILNMAIGRLAGAQIGLINIIGDGIDYPSAGVPMGFVNISLQPSTIPVGIVNIVRGGRISLDISRDPFGLSRGLLLVGSRYFYTIYGIKSRDLTPSRKASSDTSFGNSVGIGGCIPIDEDMGVRPEMFFYSPTYRDHDFGFNMRALLEWQSPFLTLYGGVEHFDFIYTPRFRSDRYSGRSDSFYSLTAGLTVNFIGGWR